MVKIVILGSTRHAPYEILAPEKIPGATNDDPGYEVAKKTFHPAIDAADLILVWCPDGIGEHTQRDIDHAVKAGKRIHVITPFLVYTIEAEHFATIK